MEPEAIDVPQADSVEPDIRRYLDAVPQDRPDLYTASIEQVRAQYRSTRQPSVVPEVAEVVDTTFDGPAGPVAVRIYRASVDPAPTILWFHGGGWVVGDLDTAELPTRTLCSEARCTVVSVDYRRAPESPFPAAYHDCLASLHWVRDNASELRIDLDRLIIGGDSAGGNLAAAVAIADRDAGGSLAGQMLIYPVVEVVDDWPDRDDRAEDFLLGGEAMDWFFAQYVPSGTDHTDWRLAPLHGEVAGTADAFVQTCGYDLLANEGLRYAQKLAESGVEVVIDHLAAAVHGIFSMEVEAGVRARTAASDWAQRVFSRP